MSDELQVRTHGGPRTVEVDSRHGRFAVTRSLDPYYGKSWAVTHIETGGLVAGPCTRRRARSAARKFDAMGDVWRGKRARVVEARLRASPESLAKARAIAEWAQS